MADAPDDAASMDDLLAALRAVAEPTRLRLLVLCSRGELTVSELAQILGQSQPRVSRHLEAAVRGGAARPLSRGQLGLLPGQRRQRRERAGAAIWSPPAASASRRSRSICSGWRRSSASAPSAPPPISARTPPHWDRIRSLYIDEREVEAALVEIVAAAAPRDLLDIGTGTGRMIEVLAPRVGQALGIDQSREMLAVARVNLERAGARERHGAAGRHVPAAAARRVVRRGGDPSGAALRRPAGGGDRRGGAGAAPGRAADGRRFRAASPRIPARRARPSPARLRRCRGRRMVPRGRARPGAAAASAGRSADRRDLGLLSPAGAAAPKPGPTSPAPEQVLQP